MIDHWIRNARTAVLTGCLVALYPAAVMSETSCDRDSHHEHGAHDGFEHGDFEHGDVEHGGFRHGGPPEGGPPGGGPHRFGPAGDFGVRPPPYLRELKLTDDQQDKVFAIVHAAEPALRDAAKAARKAHEALRDAGSSPQYSDAAVAPLVQNVVKAQGTMLTLRIKTDHDIYAILTPEQRSKVAEWSKEHDHDGHDHDGPPR